MDDDRLFVFVSVTFLFVSLLILLWHRNRVCDKQAEVVAAAAGEEREEVYIDDQ